MSEQSNHIRIQGPIGILEGFLSIGAKKTTFAIVICHPHPLYGGDMNNNVVKSIFKFLANEGYPVIRFNFRGVGNSEGSYANGHGERDDVVAVCNYALDTLKLKGINSILIIGYSFGAAIGCSINSIFPHLIGYIAISYPFTFIPDFITDAQISKPKLFIIGSRDDFTSLKAFEDAIDAMPEPKTKIIIPHINHFWVADENLLVEHIMPWLETLNSSEK